MTLAGGVLAWHINGQRAAEVRGVPSGVHFGVSRVHGAVEVRIEHAVVVGAAGCSAMLRPLCALMGREGNALRTVRLGGNGAWAEGDGAHSPVSSTSTSGARYLVTHSSMESGRASPMIRP